MPIEQDTEQKPPGIKAWGLDDVSITWKREGEAATNQQPNNNNGEDQDQDKKRRKRAYSMMVPGRTAETYLGVCCL